MSLKDISTSPIDIAYLSTLPIPNWLLHTLFIIQLLLVCMYFFCSLYLTLCTFTFNYWLDILPYFLSVHQETQPKIVILISSGFTLTHIKVWQDRRTWGAADKMIRGSRSDEISWLCLETGEIPGKGACGVAQWAMAGAGAGRGWKLQRQQNKHQHQQHVVTGDL